VFAVNEPGSVLVAYPSWIDWRVDRREAAATDPPSQIPSSTSFCATCWGQGKIWSPARNGEGLIPTCCPTCDGERVVQSL
jgi:hypothetical protein